MNDGLFWEHRRMIDGVLPFTVFQACCMNHGWAPAAQSCETALITVPGKKVDASNRILGCCFGKRTTDSETTLLVEGGFNLVAAYPETIGMALLNSTVPLSRSFRFG